MGMVAGNKLDSIVKYICSDHPTSSVDVDIRNDKYTYTCNSCCKELTPQATWSPK